MKCAIILFAFALVATASAVPANAGTDVVLRQRRDIDVFENTRRLIEELVKNLQVSAQQAINAITTFAAGISDQVNLFKEEVLRNIQQLRDRVSAAIQNIYGRIQNIPVAIRECAEEQRDSASAALNETLAEVWECADDRIAEISNLMNELGEVSKAAIDAGTEAIEEMRQCTVDNQGQLFQLGSCLSSVAIQTQVQVAGFAARSGALIFRINLSVASLPTALEFCAGARLLQAGAKIAQVIVQVGRCSVSSIVG